LAIPDNECHVSENYDLSEPEMQDLMKTDLPFIYPDAFEDEDIENII
jgi:hypothetical protein